MWVFLREVLTYSCIQLTIKPGKFFTCTLQFFSECAQSTKVITFFVCSGVSYFHVVLLLIVFTNFVSRIAIYVCTCNIIILLPILLSVLKISLLFSIDPVIYLICLNELSTSRLNKSIFSLRFSTKIWFPLLRKLL